ncbi:MAG: Crp/Fnr family transcriptional regulator [Bacillota bacterium]
MAKYRELKKAKLFKDLTDEQLSDFAECFHARQLAPKESIEFHEFEDAIYFVMEGRVKISYYSEDGREFIVTILEQGDVFSRHSEATAAALHHTKIYFTSISDFKNIITTNPVVAARLIKELGKILKQLNNVIQDLAFRGVSGRLARLLLREAKFRGRETANGIFFDLGLTHEEIANMVGSTRQTVTALLNSLCQRGIISYRRGKVTILDEQKLNNLAE